MTDQYEDIIHLPHHVSARRAPMSLRDRAAQFAPFAALTGYGDAIHETARRTETRIEPDENAMSELDARFRLLWEHLPERPEVTVTYFEPDGRKDGGAYTEVTGRVKKINTYARLLTLEDGTVIPADAVIGLDGELFAPLECELWTDEERDKTKLKT